MRAATADAGLAWQPAAYMRRAVRFLLEHAAGGLLFDPGMRKTSICLAAIKILRAEGLLRRVLVLAPLRPCYEVWSSANPASETRKWQDFHDLGCVVLHGPHKERLLREGLRRQATLFAINPEGLPWLQRFMKLLAADTLLVDESTKFKNTRTERYDLLEPHLNDFRRRWILTGSPAANGLLDLYGQVRLLDFGHALGPFFTHYRNEYFEKSGYGNHVHLPRRGSEAKIYKALAPLLLRLDAQDAGIELPQQVDLIVRVTLPPKVRVQYDQLERDLLTKVRGDVVTAFNAGVAAVKCRQVAAGGLYLPVRTDAAGVPLPGKRRWANLHDANTDAVEELVGELRGQPLLVAYDFEHDLDRLRKRFGKALPHLGKGVSMKNTTRLIAAWNAGDVPLLAAHPASVAHGLNLQGAAYHIAWHTLTYNYEHYDQLNRRLRRSGQRAKRVFVHHLVPKDTVAEAALAALRAKARTQGAFLAALRAYAQKHR